MCGRSIPTNFGENLVLDGVSFTLARGEKLGVLGRNGAGKSTMIRLISGAERPTSGRIETHMSVSWPLAFSGAFQPMLTGVDNIRFISRIYDQDFKQNLAFVEEFAELGPYLREEVRTYSSGMRARLAFAISMIIEFDCFLIDEIGAVGDARFHERCNRELFQNRGDRAMVIISHDASYVRDHCNRYAVLEKGKLVLFDDFDEAYDDFRKKIGVAAPGNEEDEYVPANRRELIETTHTVAIRDDGFRVRVQQADWLRDEGHWARAERAYGDVLAMYPYQRSYWVQRAHCAKEAGHFARAEACYRTACALGEPYPDVREHVLFVMGKQGISPEKRPVARYNKGAVHSQPPGLPDIALFARAAWKIEQLPEETTLSLLRAHPTLDRLLAAMINDPRFEVAQANWIRDQLAPAERSDEQEAHRDTEETGNDDAPEWAMHLAIIACPRSGGCDTRGAANAISGVQDAWDAIMADNGFPGWPLMHDALRRRLER